MFVFSPSKQYKSCQVILGKVNIQKVRQPCFTSIAFVVISDDLVINDFVFVEMTDAIVITTIVFAVMSDELVISDFFFVEMVEVFVITTIAFVVTTDPLEVLTIAFVVVADHIQIHSSLFFVNFIFHSIYHLSLYPTMKFFACILSLYILVLVAIPCVDKPEDHTLQKSEITQNTTDNNQNECDQCSPFCTCNCCASPVIQFDFNVQFDSLTFLQKCISPEYVPIFVSPYSGTIWQPPQLS